MIVIVRDAHPHHPWPAETVEVNHDEQNDMWTCQTSGTKYWIHGSLKVYVYQHTANSFAPDKTKYKLEVMRGVLGNFLERDTNVGDVGFYPCKQEVNRVFQAIYENKVARSIVE